MGSIYQKNSFRIVMGFSAICLLLLATQTNYTISSSSENNTGMSFSSYVDHSPIEVIDDVGLAAIASSGSGANVSPYIIEGWKISGSGTNGHGIEITGTTQYFIIRNCHITDADNYGIYVNDVANGTCVVANNTCIENYYGMYIKAEYSSIINNSVIDNSFEGLEVDTSFKSVIANNTCKSNFYNIYVRFSDNVTITGNYIQDSDVDGLLLSYSRHCHIEDNQFTRDGLFFWGSSLDYFESHTVLNNYVNGLPLGYYKNLSSFSLDISYGQIILVNCVDVTIQYQSIADTSTAIALYYVENCMINDYTFSYCWSGVYMESCTDVTISNCQFDDNEAYGVDITESSDVDILSSSFEDSLYGVDAEYTTLMEIEFNVFNEHYSEAISLKGAQLTCITYNDIYYSGTGVLLEENTGNTTINYNNFEFNEGYGVSIEYLSGDNDIYANYFLRNNNFGVQGYDDGFNNLWYDDMLYEGNQWSDWIGTGYYYIDGAAGSLDMYPEIADKDMDGMPDDWELIYGLDITFNDFDWDLDGDGITNGDEYLMGTIPNLADTDGDGLNDGDEFLYGTDPWNVDSDFDGMPDGWEVDHGFSPMNDYDANEDADGDGLNNLGEYENNCDPHDDDSDDDGIGDGEEIHEWGTNPLDEDTDGDGYTDLEEIQADSDPLDSSDTPDSSGPEDPNNGNTLKISHGGLILPLMAIGICTFVITRKDKK